AVRGAASIGADGPAGGGQGGHHPRQLLRTLTRGNDAAEAIEEGRTARRLDPRQPAAWREPTREIRRGAIGAGAERCYLHPLVLDRIEQQAFLSDVRGWRVDRSERGEQLEAHAGIRVVHEGEQGIDDLRVR